MSTTFEDVQSLADHVVFYMKQDWVSFQTVLKSELEGKLGIAAITSACSAIDLFSWLTTGITVVNARWKNLLDHPNKYFGDPALFPYYLVYEVSRCGVSHQFFPKKFLAITAVKNKTPFFDQDGRHIINAHGFYETVLDGITKIQGEIMAETDPAKQQVMIDAMDVRMAAESTGCDAAIAAYPWPKIPANHFILYSNGASNTLTYPITGYPELGGNGVVQTV